MNKLPAVIVAVMFGLGTVSVLADNTRSKDGMNTLAAADTHALVEGDANKMDKPSATSDVKADKANAKADKKVARAKSKADKKVARARARANRKVARTTRAAAAKDDANVVPKGGQ